MWGGDGVKKTCFAIPNLIFTYELDAVAIAIYAYLVFNGFRKWNAPLVNCKILSGALHTSEDVVGKRIQMLRKKKLIEVDEGYLFIKKKIADRPWGFWLRQKEENIKKSFLLPNEIFTLGLCPGEIAVYAFLLSCEDRDTYQCYPSYKTIAAAISMSKGTVKKICGSLN